jgi:hypothetical protein
MMNTNGLDPSVSSFALSMPLMVGPVIPDFESEVGNGVSCILLSTVCVAEGDVIDTTLSPCVISVPVSPPSVGVLDGFT